MSTVNGKSIGINNDTSASNVAEVVRRSTPTVKCSTANNSDISEKRRKRIKLLHLRDWSAAQQLLRKYDIPMARVANYADVAMDTAHRALNLHEFTQVSFINVCRVRAATEIVLNRAGYPQADDSPEDQLFADFDRQLQTML